jgi:hypothetical protein
MHTIIKNGLCITTSANRRGGYTSHVIRRDGHIVSTLINTTRLNPQFRSLAEQHNAAVHSYA